MGQWTEFDVITGNPTIMYFFDEIYEDNKKTYKQLEKDFDKKYNWNNSVVVIKKDGSITKPGRYNSYGSVDILTPKTKKIKETIVITNQGFKPAEGIMINKTTADYLKNHKLFKTCSKKVNMFSAIQKLMKKDFSLKKVLKMGPIEKYVGLQDLNVTNQKKYKNGYGILTEGIDAWVLVDPKLNTSDGKKNHQRITKVVDSLMTKICADNRISHNKPKPTPKPSDRKSSCGKRNPSPPCKKGFESKKNKKGGSCCYKKKADIIKPNVKPNKPSPTLNKQNTKIKKGCDLIIAQNVINKFSKGKLYYYRSKKKVLNTKEALKIAISMIGNKC